MGFFRRFRKKDEQVGAQPAASNEGAVGERPDDATGVRQTVEAAKAEVAKSETSPADKPRDATAALQMKEVSVEEVKARIDAGTAPVLIDVREPWEHQIANIAQATLIPMTSIPARMDELDHNAEIVVYCHLGARSWSVATYLAQNGFTDVKNLTGGIDAWARRVDRSMRTY